LPAPDTPVNREQHPERKLHVEVLEVVLARPAHGEKPRGRSPLGGHLDARGSSQIPPRKRGLVRRDFLGRAGGDHMAALAPCPRAEIHHVIGRFNGFRVVLDDDHAVAEIAQAPQRRDQAQVVALVQTDGRLVEHVHHARKLRAELRRQPNALGLAARKRRRHAIEGEVFEPDVEQEAEAQPDFLENLGGDLRPRAGERQFAEVALGFSDGQ